MTIVEWIVCEGHEATTLKCRESSRQALSQFSTRLRQQILAILSKYHTSIPLCVWCVDCCRVCTQKRAREPTLAIQPQIILRLIPCDIDQEPSCNGSHVGNGPSMAFTKTTNYPVGVEPRSILSSHEIGCRGNSSVC